LDLIEVTELALKEIVELGHELKSQVILVTDNGPAMKSRFRNFVKKTELLVHIRSHISHWMSNTFLDGVQQVDQVMAKLCWRASRPHLLSR
jgi:hypothetical protein